MPFTNPPRSDDLVCPPKRKRGRALVALGGAAALVLTGVLASPAYAGHDEVSLPGSNFEIDSNANLKVDDPAPSIDWAGVNETRKPDLASGSGDDSFGNGTKEDTAVPSVVDGSIPPNKSDLLNFGVYRETVGTTDFLHLFWHRVQEPNGTTNMDFEFNQSSTVSGNQVTPVRTEGDLLIQYDLSQGGVNPQLFVAYWLTDASFNPPYQNPALAVTPANCVASNSFPCWGLRANLTTAGLATGSINSTAIPFAESDGLGVNNNPVSVRTFGEASINFTTLLGTQGCTSFGSAYLKSRSSDSFTAALKDFIAPTAVNISNCAKVIIRKQTLPDEDPNTTMFGYTKAFNTSPSTGNTFSLADDGVQTFNGVFFGTGLTVTEDVIPQGWTFVSVDCSASTGVTPSINGATVTFALDNAADILDCTYTNQAKGSIIVEKITDDGTGAFSFTSGTLTPSPFVLTTTAAGAAGKDSRTFADLSPGTYDVAETVPAGWNLVSSTCDDGSTPASIGLAAGETVTCTFHDARERGAILITKERKHAADGLGALHPHAGVTFTVTGGELPAAGVTAVTNGNGVACVDGLVLSSFVGDYTVTESVPTGYVAAGASAKTVTVVAEGTCLGGSQADVGFVNTPLTNITVSVDSQIDGGTFSSIECYATAAGPDAVEDVPLSAGEDDPSVTLNNLAPGAFTCDFVIDP